MPQANGNVHGSSYSQNLAKSMTIEEMRSLHRRALADAEAKQTELRLVLASRYRELVGSSDEVTKMRERAQELDGLVSALPSLMEKLLEESSGIPSDHVQKESPVKETQDTLEEKALLELRRSLAMLPRKIHSALDKNNVHEATSALIELFRLIARQTDEYPLATALVSSSLVSSDVPKVRSNDLLQSQMRMTFLHVQTLPIKIKKIAEGILHSAASFSTSVEEIDPKLGAQRSAAALSALDMLSIPQESQQKQQRSVELIDMYFDAKAKLLRSLLDQLNTTNDNGSKTSSTANNAEEVLSKIVLILQYDIVVHPYQIFVLRKFPTTQKNSTMDSLPMFPAAIVQTKTTHFLTAHLPLIRTKVKSVLVEIAGTTASALGKIRQSLYDKTDGVDCRQRLDDTDGICSWEDAVGSIVDVHSLLVGIGGGTSVLESETSAAATAMNGGPSKFSLWAVLFSNTFSSLVNSLLTSSFQSVHTELVSKLKLSVNNAPPIQSILPHEAYRNTLTIASHLDSALLKVRDDAHELLVHAEERVESERRLKQSLYVQTCEIMGRLLSELRLMLREKEAVTLLIVGRLCHLLKYRLKTLSTLLDPNSSPAVLGGKSMISMNELSSAFELADDKDDGLITFQEAMEAVDSAFSGTHFHGAEMVKETLLLPSDTNGSVGTTPEDVTLDELTLLLARGLKHVSTGPQSALGAIQKSLDGMIHTSFSNWAREILIPYAKTLSDETEHFLTMASTLEEEEYLRLYTSAEKTLSSPGGVVTNVSPHITNFLMQLSFALNRSICPSDSLLPVPDVDYAKSMGVSGEILRMTDVIRNALLLEGLKAYTNMLGKHLRPALDGKEGVALRKSGPSGIAQLKNDLTFVQLCFFERNQNKLDGMEASETRLKTAIRKTDILFRKMCNATTAEEIERKHEHAFEACDLFLSSLFGKDGLNASVSAGGFNGLGLVSSSEISGKTPLFHPPLASSCRFPLLPIQADRSVSGALQARKYKEKEEHESRSGTTGGAVRAGLGFFSSMLKTSS